MSKAFSAVFQRMVQRAWPLPVGSSDMIAMSARARPTNSSNQLVVHGLRGLDSLGLGHVLTGHRSNVFHEAQPIRRRGHRDLVGRHRDRFRPVQFGGLLVLEADQGTGGHGAWKYITNTH
jgi:hypothetical protein